MSLSEIGLKASDRLMALRGLPFDTVVQCQARKIMLDYCMDLEVRFGIKCRPAMSFNHKTGTMFLDVEPVSEQDARWLAAITA